jgi:hypothetical protein
MTLSAKQDLINGWDNRHAAHLAILRAAPPDAVVHPRSGWTVKDIITHLSAWEEITLQAVEAFLNGSALEIPTAPDAVEAFNQNQREARRHLTAEEAFAQWEAIRDRIKALIMAFTDEQFNTPFPSSWGFLTLPQLVKGLGVHEKQHTAEVAALNGEQGGHGGHE